MWNSASAVSTRVPWQWRHERPRATGRSMVRGAPNRGPSDAGLRKNTKNLSRRCSYGSPRALAPLPFFEGTPKSTRCRFWPVFSGRFSAFRNGQKCCRLQHICVFNFFCGSNAKNAENAVNKNSFGSQMHKTLQICVQTRLCLKRPLCKGLLRTKTFVSKKLQESCLQKHLRVKKTLLYVKTSFV